MLEDYSVLILAGVAMYFKDLIAKFLRSIVVYCCRGEFNDDGNDSTPDRFMLLNPNTGEFKECYIINYKLYGVKWGFFHNSGIVRKTSFWLAWAEFSKNRFPMPMKVDSGSPSTVINLLNTK